jgi:hypothetical protein
MFHLVDVKRTSVRLYNGFQTKSKQHRLRTSHFGWTRVALFHLNRPLHFLIHAVQETPRRWVGAVVPDFVVTAPLEVDEIRTDAGVFQGLLQQAGGLYAYIVGADC